MTQFEQDMVHHRYRDRIKRDVEGGEESGVQGTPTFYINNERYEASWQQEVLRLSMLLLSEIRNCFQDLCPFRKRSHKVFSQHH